MSLSERIKKALAWRYKLLRDRIVLVRARAHRQRLSRTIFLGVTGSAGKTTTKDLAVAILQEVGPTTGNPKSQNYLLDVALQVLKVKRSDRFTVVEIAASGPNTLDGKLTLTRPHIGALTVVQRDHIKNFDSIEAIAEEKGKLIFALPADGTAVLNIDDPLVRRIGERAKAKRLWFGTSAEADIRLLGATSSYPDPLILELEYRGQRYTCTTSLHGTHLATAALAAIGMGIAVGIPMEQCIKGLARAETTDGRMQIVTNVRGVTFIRDDFKAPYWAFQSVLDYLKNARATRKVAVIGTLSDYSLSASKLYPKVARQAMDVADLVVFVGPHALRALRARRDQGDRSIVGFTEIEDADHFLQSELRAGDLVLLKGSNRADHLVRLFLARSRLVRCWTSGCGLNRFCDACPRVDAPAAVASHARSGRTLVGGHALPGSASGGTDVNEPASTSSAWLVVGLGNPGEAYSGSPHNIGFEALDAMVTRADAHWIPEGDGLVCRCILTGQPVVLFKPAAMINLCGPLVERQRRREGISIDRVLVVHDDADLALSDVRIKRSGSDGGHKGLRSIFSALDNDGAMPRVRIGVRTVRDRADGARALVLQPFAPADSVAIQGSLDTAGYRVNELVRGVGGCHPSLESRGVTP